MSKDTLREIIRVLKYQLKDARQEKDELQKNYNKIMKTVNKLIKVCKEAK